MTKTEIRHMVAAAAAVCEEKKAEQIRILELDPVDSGFTDYFLICSGSNDRQNQTIATAIEERMQREFGARPNSVEGYRQGEWILLDYFDFVAHIFLEEKRDFYQIERLRKTATALDLEQLKASLTKRVGDARKKQAAKKAAATKSAAKKTVAKKKSPKTTIKKSAVRKAAPKKTAAKSSRGKASHAAPSKGRAKPVKKASR